MRIAVTIAIALGVINLGFLIWQFQRDEQPARVSPIRYSAPAYDTAAETERRIQDARISELEFQQRIDRLINGR